MKNLSHRIELVNQIISSGVDQGLLQIKATNHQTDGRLIEVNNKNLIYFGNCSYLGLEHDERIKESAIKAIKDYGLQYACSRSYSSLKILDELEELLSKIFEKPTLVTPTTSIGHIANMTTILTSNDAVVLDHQVHASVKNAVMIAKSNGTHVETIRHNNLEALEKRFLELRATHDRVWYMLDGVYSMYGDGAPLEELHALMNKYEQFWCYIDDAHGMSWTGKNGQGFALTNLPSFHNQMLLAVSLVKGFGVHGGALIYPNEYLKSIVRNCGSSLMFASPMPPSNIAACIASAKIHLSSEIYVLQNKLRERISYFNMTAKGLKIPLINQENTPISFIPVGKPEAGYKAMKSMYDKGYLLNLAVFPAVPYKNTGMRAILTNHHTMQDIFEMLSEFKSISSILEQNNIINNESIKKTFVTQMST